MFFILQSYDELVPAARSLELSESSSDSGSSSSSDSDSDDSTTSPPPPPSQKNIEKHPSPIFNSPNTNGIIIKNLTILINIFWKFVIYFTLGFKGRLGDPVRILDEDLQLSETDSDWLLICGTIIKYQIPNIEAVQSSINNKFFSYNYVFLNLLKSLLIKNKNNYKNLFYFV